MFSNVYPLETSEWWTLLDKKQHKVVPIVEYKPTYFSYVKLFDCKLMLIL